MHSEEGRIYRGLRRVLDVRPQEVAALGWSWLFVFSLLAAYYVLRPIRDAMGVQGGVDNLPWLFTGTLLAMLAVNPVFAALVKRLPRERFIAIAYRFFIANLAIFAVLLATGSGERTVWVGRVFFVWTSVFNLFVVSVFWAFIVDVFDSEQGKRLFGFLAAGATLGAILGSALTSGFVSRLGATWLMVVSMALIELAVFAVRRLSRVAAGFRERRGLREEAPIGGGVLAGLTHTLRSPYLLNVSFFLFFYTITSTVLYFEQASIVSSHFADRAARTAFFAHVDLAVNVLTLAAQLFLTARLLRSIGVALTLSILPLLTLAGFGMLALAPTVAMLIAVQVARRVCNFAFARPSRELLFTVASREDKYKAKSFIDTVVYRAGDQIGSWSYALLGFLGLGLTGIAVVAMPLSMLWLTNAYWLGRRQEAAARGAVQGAPPLDIRETAEERR
jgi:AAA family ATP:ADP antiporter